MNGRLVIRISGKGPPLLLLHGLLGFGRNLQSVARKLEDKFTCCLVDLRNHGHSPWSPVMSYEAMAADLLDILDRQSWSQAAVLGHSMGGKAAMALALLEAARIDRLIAADIAPVTYGHDFKTYIDAMLAVDLGETKQRAEVDEQLKATVSEQAIRGFLMQNLESADTGLRWRANLQVLLEAMPSISSFPEALAGSSYAGPTLFIRGGRSSYVRSDHEPVIHQFFPQAQITTIENAGHWLHAEQPMAFVEAVEAFLLT